jgi:23S rRNA pseudouridine1911/1915/1917 synthase
MKAQARQGRVLPAEAGRTLASVVRRLLDDLPWSKARDLCKTGRVLVDGEAELDPATRVREGAEVSVDVAAPKLRHRGLSEDALVHADRDLVVVRKPAGIATAPFERGERDTLVDLARITLRRLEGGRGSPPLRVVQRLDKETSGLLVFARTRAAERHLQQQLRAHTVERRYLAIVHGRPRPGTHDSLLVPDRGDGLRGSWGTRRSHRGEAPKSARRAVTHVEVIERLGDCNLIACSLETGKQHQIRIHLSEAGCPLVGERVYIREHAGPLVEAGRCMLHAEVLGLIHPRSERRVRFEEPPPSDFEGLLERLRRGQTGRVDQ